MSQPIRMSAAEYKKQFGGGQVAQGSVAGMKETKGEIKAQIRIPALPTPNKTEQRFIDYISRLYHPALVRRIRFEPWRFQLPSLTHYTPDVVIEFNDGRKTECWEVKGPHIHNQRSIHALKEAAESEPGFNFGFAQWRGEWHLKRFNDRILPGCTPAESTQPQPQTGQGHLPSRPPAEY